MRVIISITTIIALLVTVGITISEAGESSKLYTAHNIWRMRWFNMKCINYKYGGDILPVGTMVKNVGTGYEYQTKKPYITFKTVYDNRVYKIYFNKMWHPKKSIEDYKDMMFTTKNFEAQTEGLSEMEIDAIKKGVLVKGMSKRAVFICYGRPPEHYTPQLAANAWYYWMNKLNRVEIKFDQDGRLDLIDPKLVKEAEITDESIIQSGSASGTQVAAIPKIKVNKKEPWTGTWKVKGGYQGGIFLNLKQSGINVKSIRGSSYDFKGKIKGNRLKGTWGEGPYWFRVDLKMSQDGMSFKGTEDMYGVLHVKGERQK